MMTRARFKHEALVAIGTFDRGFVPHLQIDARMAQRAAAAITGDAGGVGFDDFGGLDGHGTVPNRRDGGDHTS
jgi:hypothetical protein